MSCARDLVATVRSPVPPIPVKDAREARLTLSTSILRVFRTSGPRRFP